MNDEILFVRNMKVFVLIFTLILSLSSQNSIRDNSFLTAEDFKRANELSDEQIDRGEGIISTKAEFNSSFYGGDVVDDPSNKRKDVSIRLDSKNSRSKDYE
jgi:hypothetical protein